MKPEQVAPKDVFLKFNYPELKDLGKHFLTIASATAVFLVSFVEKIVRLPEPVPGDSSLGRRTVQDDTSRLAGGDRHLWHRPRHQLYCRGGRVWRHHMGYW